MRLFDNRTTEFSRTNAFQLAKLSMLAYQKKSDIKEALISDSIAALEIFDERNTQAFICSDDDKIIISVRGTDGLADAMTDINVDLVHGVGGKVHEGFNTSASRLWKTVMEHVRDRGTRSLFLTGHSLGAGIATILTARLIQEKDEPVNGLYTFGSPRVGDREFAKNFNESFGNQTWRFVNNNDVVTRVPFRSLGYSHVGELMYFDENGKYRPDISWWEKLLDRVHGRIDDLFELYTDGIKDHKMKNYVSVTDRHVNTLNAHVAQILDA